MKSNSSTVTIDGLLNSASSAIEALQGDFSTTDDERVVESYCNQFDVWIGALEGDKISIGERERSDAEELLRRHAIIMDLLGQQVRRVDLLLKDRKSWLKGVKSYLDKFPKRVSTIRARQG
jgi:hypothetical protein